MSKNNSTNNTTTTSLQMGMCFLLNLPSGHLECAATSSDQNSQPSTTTSSCIYCPIGSTFSTGEGLDDYYSGGHVTLLLINGLTSLVGAWGTFMSLLIIAALRRGKSGTSFDTLLTALAWFDMVCCISSVLFAASVTTWFQNWSRGFVPLFGHYFSGPISHLAKSGSALITIVITVERYVAIAFPFAARAWFSPLKTQVLVGLVCVFTVFNGLARFGSSYIGKNAISPGIGSTAQLDYIMYPSSLESIAGPFELFDFFVPIPLLLIFNGMIFYKIRQISAKRKELSSSQRKELHAGKILLPIVVVLTGCSIVPLAALHALLGKAPTEVTLFGFSLYAVNSAVNFPIYYWNSEGFRKDAGAVLASWFGRCGRKS